MHRRSLLDRHGGFDPRMGDRHDWEFVLRCTSDKAARAVPALLCSRYGADSLEAAGPAGSGPLDRAIGCHPVAEAVPGVALERIGAMFSLSHPVPEPHRRRPVSIVIPSFEVEPYLRACINSLEAFTAAFDIELIVVDNASGEGVRAYLAGLARDGRARVVLNEANLGFSFAVNQGIELARPGNDVVLLNNDAFVTQGWLGALQAVLDAIPRPGSWCRARWCWPARNPCPCIGRPAIRAGNATSTCRGTTPTCWTRCSTSPRGYMELTYAPFFCIYIPRPTLRAGGPAGRRNGPHYASDRLYCDAVRELAGRRIVYTPHAKVYHFVQRATADLKSRDRELYRDMFTRNDWRAIAARRSGRDPG